MHTAFCPMGHLTVDTLKVAIVVGFDVEFDRKPRNADQFQSVGQFQSEVLSEGEWMSAAAGALEHPPPMVDPKADLTDRPREEVDRSQPSARGRHVFLSSFRISQLDTVPRHRDSQPALAAQLSIGMELVQAAGTQILRPQPSQLLGHFELILNPQHKKSTQ